MLVDGGASLNLMPWNICKKLGVQAEELVKTYMVLSDFMGGPTEAKGVNWLSGAKSCRLLSL